MCASRVNVGRVPAGEVPESSGFSWSSFFQNSVIAAASGCVVGWSSSCVEDVSMWVCASLTSGTTVALEGAVNLAAIFLKACCCPRDSEDVCVSGAVLMLRALGEIAFNTAALGTIAESGIDFSEHPYWLAVGGSAAVAAGLGSLFTQWRAAGSDSQGPRRGQVVPVDAEAQMARLRSAIRGEELQVVPR